VDAASELAMKPIQKNKRYPWAFVGKINVEWVFFDDIALKFEAFVRNEAVSDSTKSTRT
jgi:hypothetical protein